jgi:hypothetical protein
MHLACAELGGAIMSSRKLKAGKRRAAKEEYDCSKNSIAGFGIHGRQKITSAGNSEGRGASFQAG